MKLAWLVCGPSGCGKSTWIRERAKQHRLHLIRYTVRTDRSLRQGRPLLFAQHRSAEPTLIWLEGADTLTSDAQAFLRRILETAGSNVEFALEVRDETTMSPPLISRCQRIILPSVSLRKQASIKQIENRGYAEMRKIRQNHQHKLDIWHVGSNPCDSIIQAKQQGLLPDTLIHNLLRNEGDQVQFEIYRKWGDGANPWLLLSYLALKQSINRDNGAAL
jgi:hypothetical protein